MNKPNIFFRLTKVDAIEGIFEAIATAEVMDKSGETCHYETTKPYYQKWSDGIKKASGGKSLGNIRAMHSNIAAGKLIALDFDDVRKEIRITGKVIDKAEKEKLAEGVYTGVSQGGEYVEKWKENGINYYTADPSEISIVDNPCLGVAEFQVVKADGSTEMRKFLVAEIKPPVDLEQVWKAKDGSTWPTKVEARKQNDLIDARETVAKTADPINALLGQIEDTLDKRDELENKETPDMKKLLAKSELWDVHDALCALGIVEGLICGEMLKDENNPVQIVDLKAACVRLKSFISAEITEGAEVLAAAVKVEMEKLALAKGDMEMAAGHMEHVHAIHKAASNIMTRCMKCMGSDAEKIMKAEDGDDTHDHLKVAHKKAGMIMERCMKMGSKVEMENGDDADGDDDANKMTKALAENGELRKTITRMTETLTEIQKRLKTVEDQPAARKGSVMIIAKGHEREETPENSAAETKNLNISGLSPEQARTIMV